MRFQVVRYLKGSGPGVAAVKTGVREGMSYSISIRPGAGEAWRVYAHRSTGGALETSVCDGSTRLRGEQATGFPDPGPGDASSPPPSAGPSIAPAAAIPLLGLLLVGGFGAWKLGRSRPH